MSWVEDDTGVWITAGGSYKGTQTAARPQVCILVGGDAEIAEWLGTDTHQYPILTWQPGVGAGMEWSPPAASGHHGEDLPGPCGQAPT